MYARRAEAEGAITTSRLYSIAQERTGNRTRYVCMSFAVLPQEFSSHVQGWAKEWSLGCVNLRPTARGSPEEGFTQPRAHLIAHLCTLCFDCQSEYSANLQRTQFADLTCFVRNSFAHIDTLAESFVISDRICPLLLLFHTFPDFKDIPQKCTHAERRP